jgi:hypothetical protein
VRIGEFSRFLEDCFAAVWLVAAVVNIVQRQKGQPLPIGSYGIGKTGNARSG